MAMVRGADFGTLLRRRRKAAGLTQEELAERAGLSVRGISDLERGLKHRPHKDTVQLLADALELSGEERDTFEAARRRLGSSAMAEQERDAAGTLSSTAEPVTALQTFLIADIRGYTHFTQEQGDEAAARLAGRFAEVVEELVPGWEGRVIELRGDEALVVFASARQALRAALALQERFCREMEADASLPLTVGIGLDAGEAIAVKGGYRGAALNLAARLQKLATSGEVLASEGVVHLARKTEGIRYLERGAYELKGFGDGVRVVQVVGEEQREIEAPAAAGRFEVSLLGPFGLRRDGKPLETDRWQRRMESLFKVIATAPSHRRSRDEIVELLWPDAPPQAGAGNLRLVAHLLRRALGDGIAPDLPSPLRSERGWIGLDPAYSWEIDLERFEQLLSAAGPPAASAGRTAVRGPAEDTRLEALEEAAALYRGEPLAEDIYEDWAAPIRDRVQRQWRELCLRLAGLSRSGRAVDAAAGWYERALEADPLDEDALRGLLEVLGELGRTTEALRRFRQFEHKLGEEIGVPPMPETLAVVERLKTTLDQAPPSSRVPAPAGGPAEELGRPGYYTQGVPGVANVVPSYPLPAPGPLLGRQADLDAVLIELPEGGGHGPGPARLVLVAAEAGMGKTRLLSEVARRAGEADMLLLAGGCYEEEGRLPYGPFHDALLDYVQAQPEAVLRSQLGDLLPLLAEIVPEVRARIPGLAEVQSSDPQAQRLRLFSTVAHALQQISAERALVLLLDDLHWADDPTLQLLHFLLRQTGMQRTLIAGSYRSDEVMPGTLLAQLVTRSGERQNVKVVELAPLSEPDIELLLADRLGGECSRDLATALHERSTGNPFFSLQMMRLLEQEGSLRQEDGRWSLAPGTRVDLPPAVRETVARRLRHITPEVRNTLAFGAVLGREFDYVALEAMADLDEDALFGSLDAAHDAGLLRETGSGYAFVHPLLWEVIYARVPDQRRRRLHDRAGLALEGLYGEGSGERAPELAWHFLESGNAPRALQYSLLAAGQAERVVAYDEAERYYRAALPLARSLGDRQREAEALEGLGGVLKAVSRLDEAVQALEEAAQLYRALDDLDAEGRAAAQDALAHYFRETQEEGLSFFLPVLKRVEERDKDHPSHTLALLYASLPRLYGAPLGRYHEELSAAERAAELGRAVGDTSIVAAAYLRQGTALLELRELARALAALDEAIRLAEPIEDLFTLAAAGGFASDVLREWGKLERALERADQGFTAAERRGGLEQMGGLFRRAYFAARDVGRWDRAVDFCERFLALQQSLRGEHVNEVPLLWLGEIALYRGTIDEAEQYFEGCQALTPEPYQPGRQMRISTLLAEQDLLQERPEAALDRMTPVLDLPPPLSLQGAYFVHAQMLLTAAHALAKLGRTGEATALVERVISADVAQWYPHVLVDALRARGIVLAGDGCREEAMREFGSAVSQAHAMPFPYGEARALYHWGMLAMESEPIPARRRLEEALTIFQRLGAQPYVERTEQALSQLAGV